MGKKKLFAFFAVALMVIAAFYMFGYQAPSQTSYQKAGIDDLLASKSTRNSFTYDAVIASLDSAYYALMATPLAIYYEGKENKTFPLIVVGEDQEIQDHGVSKSVKRFFEAKPSIGAVSVGKTPDAGAMISQLIEGGTVSKTSFALALRFWKQTDTVLLNARRAARFVPQHADNRHEEHRRCHAHARQARSQERNHCRQA